MNTFSKLGLAAALTLSAITLAPSAFAGNPHWGEEQLDRSRATALRAHCMDANGHCIESLMLGDNSTYRCRMQRQQHVTGTSNAESGWISTMFCL